MSAKLEEVPGEGRRENDRILNRRGRRHFRRRYSVTEVKLGLAIGVVLVAITAWIVWRGGRPDPELAMTAADLFDEKAKKPAGRGSLPPELAPAEWIERGIASFDASNVYEKIDGREGYYKSFGFVALDFVSIANRAQPEMYIDVEMYDLARVENAAGAMAGEVPAGGKTRLDDRALIYEGRNSVLIAKGRWYVRLIGSDESEAVRAALASVRARIAAALPGAPLPIGFAIFAGFLEVPPERIGFEAENAFSFGFARDVHVGRLADETELFVVIAESAAAAGELAAKFRGGFKEYGEDAGASNGVTWVRDRYLSTFAGARAVGKVVAGVRGAPDRKRAEAELARLEAALAKVPEEELGAAAKKRVAPEPKPADAPVEH